MPTVIQPHAGATENEETSGIHEAQRFAITVYQGAKNPHPVHEYELSWADYCIALDELLVVEAAEKTDLPLWSPVKLKPGGTRAAKFIEHVSAIGLDIDHGSNELLAAVLAAPFAKYVYTSPSDQGADAVERRFRVVVPTTRPMAADECRAAHFAIAAALGLDAKGQGIAQTSDPSRGWFAGKLQGSPDRQHWITDGAPFDPGTVMPAPELAIVVARGAGPRGENRKAKVAAIVNALGPWSDHIGRRSDLCDAIGGMLRRSGATEAFCREVIEAWLDGSNTQAEPKAVKKGVDRALGAWTKAVREVSGPERFLDLLDTADQAALVVQALRDSTVGNIVNKKPSPPPAPPSVEGAAVVGEPIDTSLVLDTDKQGRPLRTIDNVHRFVEHCFGAAIRFEVTRGRIVCADIDPCYGYMPDGPWTDDHTTALTRLCERNGVCVQPQQVERAVSELAHAHKFNSVEDWLVQAAKKWDGVLRVDGALVDLWGCKNEPAALIASRVFFLSLAARGLMPGCKVDTCVVFHGEQSLRKSSSFRALIGDEWFSDSEIAEGKEAQIAMRAKWLWEVAENASMAKRDRNKRKQFITEQIGNYRGLYAKNAEDVPRLTVLCATTNDDEFLDDPTGNRRFPVVHVEREADLRGITQLREQLLGEACARVVRGEIEHPDALSRPRQLTWWPDAEEERLLDAARDEHIESDAWSDRIAAWAARQTEPFAVADALQYGVGLELAKCGKGHEMRAGTCLKRAGYRRVKIDGQRRWRR